VIARNPMTPHSVLEWLAQQGSADAVEALRGRRTSQGAGV
jgi:hypothetical protein